MQGQWVQGLGVLSAESRVLMLMWKMLTPVTRKADKPRRSISAWCAEVWHRRTVSEST